MKHLLGDRNRSLLFRTFFYLVGGLLAVAIILDFGFGYLQSSQESETDRWLESTFFLVERQLAAVPPLRRDVVAAELSDSIGVDVRLLASDDVFRSGAADEPLAPLVNADGNTSYLHDATSIDAIIRLGPVMESQPSLLLRMLPPLFYLSIFVVVSLWLRPLLKDINLITDGAQRFAADYREPLATAERATELTGLARNIDTMSSRLSGLLRNQKELIAALSHEMRTPLARIRFALAVIGDSDDSRRREQLEALNDDLQEIDDLIASMLNYARLDHPDTRMHWQEVPVEPWLKLIVEKSRVDSMQITTAVDGKLDKAWMDPRLMELALSNLLVNACRYGVEQVNCAVAREGDRYLLSIEDDGKGIPEAERESVFKAFTRIDDSRNRDTGGYGLGLAIVARIAALHGGVAAVERSEALGGARFVLRWRPRKH